MCDTFLKKVAFHINIGPLYRSLLKNIKQKQLAPNCVTFSIDLYLEGLVFVARVKLKRKGTSLVSDVGYLFPNGGDQLFYLQRRNNIISINVG